MNKLNELAKLCKAGVSLNVNEHISDYKTIEEYIDMLNDCCKGEIPEERKADIIKNNTLVELYFFPNTPLGHYKIVHWDIDLAINEALEIMKNKDS